MQHSQTEGGQTEHVLCLYVNSQLWHHHANQLALSAWESNTYNSSIDKNQRHITSKWGTLCKSSKLNTCFVNSEVLQRWKRYSRCMLCLVWAFFFGFQRPRLCLTAKLSVFNYLFKSWERSICYGASTVSVKCIGLKRQYSHKLRGTRHQLTSNWHLLKIIVECVGCCLKLFTKYLNNWHPKSFRSYS